MKLLCNVLCADIEAQFAFYAAVLGAPEAVPRRSSIYRALVVGDSELGLNARPAYALLGLEARQPQPGSAPGPVVAYPTFLLDGPEAVDAAAARVPAAGGRVVKAPFATYYGQWQAVASDREGNVFRLAAPSLPAGIAAPRLGAVLPSPGAPPCS